ncbi:A52R-like family protein [Hypsugopox virus]|nr:A52R-like family protein [Hypsugopox virus]
MDSLPSYSCSFNCKSGQEYDITFMHDKENKHVDFTMYTKINEVVPQEKDDYFEFDTSTIYFMYDMHNSITSSDNVLDIIEEYISWRAHIGRIGFVPKNTGKLYANMLQLDLEASNVFGNYTSLINVYKLNDDVNSIHNLKLFINKLNYNFLNEKSLLLVGLFGYMAQYWSSKKMYRYIPEIFPLLISCVPENSLNSIKYYE